MLSNIPVEIHHGRKIVEIGSIQINKGSVVEHFVQSNNYDAVLCAGDDETDESVFRLSDDRLITVKVGSRTDTSALYRVASPKIFRGFLTNLLNSLSIS